MGNIVDRRYPKKQLSCLKYIVHTKTGIYTSNRIVCNNKVLCVKLVPKYKDDEYIPDHWVYQVHEFIDNKSTKIIFSDSVDTLVKAKTSSRKKLIELGVVFQNVVRSSALKRKILF